MQLKNKLSPQLCQFKLSKDERTVIGSPSSTCSSEIIITPSNKSIGFVIMSDSKNVKKGFKLLESRLN